MLRRGSVCHLTVEFQGGLLSRTTMTNRNGLWSSEQRRRVLPRPPARTQRARTDINRRRAACGRIHCRSRRYSCAAFRIHLPMSSVLITMPYPLISRNSFFAWPFLVRTHNYYWHKFFALFYYVFLLRPASFACV